MSVAMYIKLSGSVGRNGKNNPDDVMTIQARLAVWSYKGLLPDIPPLVVDGQSGTKTRKAIGAFQVLYCGFKKPDCRVDPGGLTLYMLYESTLPPMKKQDYLDWLKAEYPATTKAAQGVGEALGLVKPELAENWDVPEELYMKLVRNWGSELATWYLVPPPRNRPEAKAFQPPPQLAGHYKTVLAWKTASPTRDCPLRPQNIQILALLRDDDEYWTRQSKGSRIAKEIGQTCARTSIQDYRDYVLRQGLCPRRAHARLVAIQKDMAYEMFLGMYSLLSPQTGVASSGAQLVEALAQFREFCNSQKK